MEERLEPNTGMYPVNGEVAKEAHRLRHKVPTPPISLVYAAWQHYDNWSRDDNETQSFRQWARFRANKLVQFLNHRPHDIQND